MIAASPNNVLSSVFICTSTQGVKVNCVPLISVMVRLYFYVWC